ncbi:MAG TPA: heavy metal-associated domain-containing protein [Gemmatimonadales bacterium]|jgi:copper chaperone CopZ|nr:heavy metal-associated domain-containing protein [Gemmatimonadales bacterium]
MSMSSKAGMVLAAAITGGSLLCPICGGGVQAAGAQAARFTTQAPDTATVRLHILGMTCGSCPVTARLALNRLAGVYSARVTLEDSLGVIRYNPHKVTPVDIAAHLTRLTGFRATVVPNDSGAPERSVRP